VAVGHHRNVLIDERHRCRVLDLLQRFRLDAGGREKEHGLIDDSIHDVDVRYSSCAIPAWCN
jgi:hypothetical protein